MRIAVLFCFVSVFTFSWSSSATDLLERVRSAKSEAEFSRIVEGARSEPMEDGFLKTELNSAAYEPHWQSAQTRLTHALSSLAAVNAASRVGKVSNPALSAKTILADPRYRDPGTSQGRNWLSKALDRLGKAIADFFAKLRLPAGRLGGGVPGLGFGALESVVWFLLGGGLIAFLVYFLTKFRLNRLARSKSLGLLDDDEQDLTADEWLVRASQLEQEAKFREAVRCLYLASLIRLDEAGILKFVRFETNWEHLRRFESNPNRPVKVLLKDATKEFDRIWYGHRVKGSSDSAWFKEFYETVLVNIKERLR